MLDEMFALESGVILIHMKLKLGITSLILPPTQLQTRSVRARQRCDNAAMMLVIPFSLKTMELLQNGMHPYSGAVRAVWLALL